MTQSQSKQTKKKYLEIKIPMFSHTEKWHDKARFSNISLCVFDLRSKIKLQVKMPFKICRISIQQKLIEAKCKFP